MRLSRTGWNNVIIFAMLLMIFLFNGLHHKLMQSDSSDLIQPLLPTNSFVLTLAYPEMKIERVGTSWRATDLVNMPLPARSPSSAARPASNHRAYETRQSIHVPR